MRSSFSSFVTCLTLTVACGAERTFDDGPSDSSDSQGDGGSTSTAGMGGDASGGEASTGGRSSVGGMAGGAASGGTDPGVGTVTVLSSEPENDAEGVFEDVEIVIDFDKAMDRESTEAAYESADLPANDVDFVWSESDTRLTIAPEVPLPYTETAKEYDIAIRAGAEAVDGSVLKQKFSLSFKLARQLQVALKPLTNTTKTGYWRGDNTMGDCGSSYVCMGDGASKDQYKAFLTFDLSSLPEDVSSLDASLSWPCNYVGNPFATLGALHFEQVVFTSVGTTAFSAAALSQVASYTTSAASFTADASSAVLDDYENRGTRSAQSQFRAAFATPTDNDSSSDVCLTALNGPTLTIDYLVP